MNLFVEPKKKNNTQLDVKISHEAMVVLQEYSDFTRYELGELLNIIADKLLDDPKFVNTFKVKRSNKKIMKVYENHTNRKVNGWEPSDEDTPFK